MKNTAKRVLAWVLVAALVLGLAGSLLVYVSAAEVTYVTGNDNKYGTVIANWGTREEEATFLSPNAEKFYTSGNTYDDFMGLVDTNSKTEYNDGLYSALQTLMRSRHDTQTSYDGTRTLFAFTDCQQSKYSVSGAISCFYSGKKLGPSWDSGNTWNREHTWPNSKDLNGADGNDIMMLRPTSSSVNSSRGNKAYGESSGYYYPNSESGGTYDVRGDAARIILYVYVRWGDTNINGTGSIWGTSGVMESKEVLLKWMQEDPVDTWEMGRNDSVESITGTRNVFVDYPELGFALFNEAVPDMVTPSGEAADQNGTQYTITAVSENTAKGTVQVRGKTITATPAAGYKTAGYQVTQGAATVTHTGNTLTVEAESDCVVKVLFEALGSNSIAFVENGVVAKTQQVFDGNSLTLPEPSTAVPEDCIFVGWVSGRVDHAAEKPSEIKGAGQTLLPTQDMIFFALYQYSDPEAEGSSGIFEQHTGVVVPGTYLIVSDGAAMSAVINSGNRFDLDTGILISGTQASNAAESSIWTLEELSDGVFSLYNAATGKYASGTGVKNKGKVVDSVADDYAKWEIGGTAEPYTIENVGNRTDGVNYTLRRNADNGFAPYAASTGTGISLYKQTDGAVIYTTSTYEGELPGDLDGNGVVSDTDAVYLLRCALFGESEYPLNQSGDMNSDGVVTDADAVYLLRHTLFPTRYPLYS